MNSSVENDKVPFSHSEEIYRTGHVANLDKTVSDVFYTLYTIKTGRSIYCLVIVENVLRK